MIYSNIRNGTIHTIEYNTYNFSRLLEENLPLYDGPSIWQI